MWLQKGLGRQRLAKAPGVGSWKRQAELQSGGAGHVKSVGDKEKGPRAGYWEQWFGEDVLVRQAERHLAVGPQTSSGGRGHLILRKMLSRSRFMSTKVRVWCTKRSLICCSRTLDRLLKFRSISLVFSKRSSLGGEDKGLGIRPRSPLSLS